MRNSRVIQLRLVAYPVRFCILYRVLYIPSGCLGFLNHQQYLLGKSPMAMKKVNPKTAPIASAIVVLGCGLKGWSLNPLTIIVGALIGNIMHKFLLSHFFLEKHKKKTAAFHCPSFPKVSKGHGEVTFGGLDKNHESPLSATLRREIFRWVPTCTLRRNCKFRNLETNSILDYPTIPMCLILESFSVDHLAKRTPKQFI